MTLKTQANLLKKTAASLLVM